MLRGIVASLLLTACAPAARPTSSPVVAPAAARFVKSAPIANLEQWAVTRADGPPLDVFIAHGAEKRPLVVLLPGSHCLPLFLLKGNRTLSTLFLQFEDVSAELSRVHFAVIERRGVKSFVTPPADEAAMKEMDRCTPTHGGVDKRERVADVVSTVAALAREPWVGPIYLLGHSEGADIAAGVARALDARIAGAGLLSGAGATRFFDDIVLARRGGNLPAVKSALDDLIALTGPTPPVEYAGALSTRQVSYAIDTTPLDDLRAVRTPLFVSGGTDDNKAPIESAELVVAELLRDRTRAIRYVMLPGLDHALRDSNGEPHVVDVVRAFVDWALTDPKPRLVTIGLEPTSSTTR